ncbi:MAG: nuclear transport factor 2 family protein [Pseudomonadales bacterium]|nr:nuclear transport factor 2 family protein [Pseudomonadales bacterium]
MTSTADHQRLSLNQKQNAEQRPPLPPFSAQTALIKVKSAEDAWNSRDPKRVSLAYTKDSEWRNRAQFIKGRDQIEQFLTLKWDREQQYRLQKTLWAFTDNRIAVTFEYEWHNHEGNWFRSYGNELWQFASNGLMEQRIASINDLAIDEQQRYL